MNNLVIIQGGGKNLSRTMDVITYLQLMTFSIIIMFIRVLHRHDLFRLLNWQRYRQIM